MTGFDFDRTIERRGTGSVKWDLVDELFHGKGLLPFWVADMDFASPEPVIRALAERTAHGVFGYTATTAAYYSSIAQWYRDRHGWAIDTQWLVYHPGVVPALNCIVRTFTRPGDGIIIQRPVYYPFSTTVLNNGRELVDNPLVIEGGRYRMDLDDLREKARGPRTTMLILCNPHNPVGRAWSKSELGELFRICDESGVMVVSDEIWGDMVYPHARYVPFGSLSERALERSLTCIAPSKTFNLAGLHTANIIAADAGMRKAITSSQRDMGILGPTVFGAAASVAAYTEGGPWLDALMAYLAENLGCLRNFLRDRLPRLSLVEPEGTYLAWIDCGRLGLERASLKRLITERAGVAPDYGYIFGVPGGEGFVRINYACPRSMLEKGLLLLEKAVRETS